MTIQRKQMHFYRLGARVQGAAYSPDATLPPREIFEEVPEVLAAYDEFTSLQSGYRRELEAERVKRQAAKDATAEYREGVRAVMAKGQDPNKVKDRTPQLLVEAEAHAAFAAEAKLGVRAAGHRLGSAVQEHGERFYAPAEQQMAEAAEQISAAARSVTDAWNQWAQAWGLRRHLSSVTCFGGELLNYREGTLPPAVAEALSVVASTLGDLERLRSDERNLADFRKADTRAAAANDRAAW